MKTLISTLALAGLAALSTSAMAGTAIVKYVEPDNFADFPDAEGDGEELIKKMTEHISRLADKLPASQELVVEITDIDLAGTVKPNFRNPRDIRIIKGRVDWPAMSLRFKVTENGQVIKQGEDHLRDQGFHQRSNRYYPDDPLRYEKKMVDDWAEQRLGVTL